MDRVICAEMLSFSLSRLIVPISHGVISKKWKSTEAPGDPYPIPAGDYTNYIPNMSYETPIHIFSLLPFLTVSFKV